MSGELTPSTAHGQPDSIAIGSSLSGDESNLTSETLVKIQKAFSESGSNLHALINHRQSSVTIMEEEKMSETCYIKNDSEKKLFKTNNLTVRESKEHYENDGKDDICFSEGDLLPHQSQNIGREAPVRCYSSQIKVEPEKDVHLVIPKDDLCQQAVPRTKQAKGQQSLEDEVNTQSKENESMIAEDVVKSAGPQEAKAGASSSQQSACTVQITSKPRAVRLAKQQSLVDECNKTVCENLQMTEHRKVSDHIQWFNKLSLNEPNRTKVKSPLKFQRTPVRQSVRRINSLLDYNRPPGRQKLDLSDASLVKSVSCDSSLPSCVESTSKDSSVPCTQSGLEQSTLCSQLHDAISKSNMDLTSKSFLKMKRHPDAVQGFRGSTRICKEDGKCDGRIKVPLDDLTNHDIVKAVVNNNTGIPPRIKNKVLRKPSDKERVWYKGSPKNPIGKTQLLPSSKPVDL